MTDWLTIRVVLEGNAGGRLSPAPGRVMLVHVDHTFAEFAEAIDRAFGRWDLTPFHEFGVEGRLVASSGNPIGPRDEVLEAEDSDEVTLGEAGLRLGARFTYLFDPGEGWRHDCLVESVGVDPFEVYGEEPATPQAVFGWGVIPDQYGRLSEEDEEAAFEEDSDEDLDEDEDEDAWAVSEVASWSVVERALDKSEAELDDEPDRSALASAVERLRRQRRSGWPYDVLWAASGLEDTGPEDDEALWLEVAAGIVSPRAPVPLEPDTEAAWAALEPADWAGAVIGLVRAGPGQPADPEELLDLIATCPEVEGEDLSEEDEEVLLAGLDTVGVLWQAVGVLDDERRLTPLGRWGLPRSLELAWS